MKARERKREALVAKYAAKRAALKAAGDYLALQKNTQERKSSASSQPLQTNGSSSRIHASVWNFSRNVS